MASVLDPNSCAASSRASRSAWSHVVHIEHESGTVAAPTSPSATSITFRAPSEQLVQNSCDDSQLQSCNYVGDGNVSSAGASGGKKSVWKLPSSNVYTDGGVVMDAEHWPTLSDSARVSPKSSSEFLKGLSDVSASSYAVSLSPSSKTAPSSPNTNLTSSPSSPARHKSTKHGNLSVSLSGGFAVSPPLPVSLQMSLRESGDQSTLETSPKDLLNKKNSGNNDNWDDTSNVAAVFPQLQGRNDQRSQGASRRGSNGQHNGYGNRWNQERGGSQWNHRNFLRDVHNPHLHSQWGARPYLQHPIAARLIASPPPPRLGGNNLEFIGFSSAVCYVPHPMQHYPEPSRGVTFTPYSVHSPPAMFYRAFDPQLDPHRSMLLKQIDYYFSPENLCKDTYLRQNMDEQGWVPISLIAGFNRVKQITSSIQYILDTMRLSNVVEVQGDKIRKKNGWKSWVLNTSNLLSTTEPVSPESVIYDGLAAQFHSFGLENASNSISMKGSAPFEAILTGSESGNFNNQSVVRDP